MLELLPNYMAPPSTRASTVEGARYTPARPDYVERFYALLKVWKRDTQILSSIQGKIDHPAMRQIVAIGERAVGLICDDLRVEPSFLFLALPEILGVNPISPALRGQPIEIAEAWVEWLETEQIDGC